MARNLPLILLRRLLTNTVEKNLSVTRVRTTLTFPKSMWHTQRPKMISTKYRRMSTL